MFKLPGRWEYRRMQNPRVTLLVVWLLCSLLPVVNAQETGNGNPKRNRLTKFNRQIIDDHKQLYNMSCIPMSVEMVLKLLERAPVSYYKLQKPWKNKADGSFRNFDGKTFEGVTFHQQFALARGDRFPLARLFETIDGELKAGRFVIVGLASGPGWHNWVIYDEDKEGDFLAVSKAGGKTLEATHVKEIITKMKGTDIGTYELNPLVFVHATVIDATGAGAQPDATVVITGDRITAIGKSTEIRPPTNAMVVDATGKFLIPGLWDMHVHWYEQAFLPLFIANGVTGIRMMWGMPIHHEWRTGSEQGSLLGPRMLIASAIVDGPKPFWPGSITAANEAEGRQAVMKTKQDGADFVKVYSLLPRDAYFAIADEAKKQGIPFAGHVPISVSVGEASEAGQTSVEHLTGILSACSSREADLLKSSQELLTTFLVTNETMAILPGIRQQNQLALQTYNQAKADKLFAELGRNHTWQCPTLTVLRNMRFIDDSSITNDPRLKYMPRGLIASWDPAQDDRIKDRTGQDLALEKNIYRQDLQIVGAMQRAGVGILAGTDTGNPYCFPGFSLHDELSLLVSAGLTPMEALQAATLNPARFMGRENELGTIETGKLADLVLLDANPLDNIANTRKIIGVVLGGRLFPKSSLDEMRSKTKALANRSKISVALFLFKIIGETNVDVAIQQYHKLRAARSDAYDLSEEQLKNLGYGLIENKRIKEAIKILKLNAETYPQSSNVYESLGDGYLADGDKKLAAENFEKSLQIDPKNSNAFEKLEQLRLDEQTG
jgi:imidazolonepropionase-like amidohydrolase